MFDFVRKHNRVMQVLLFLLIVPSFVLFGLEGYNRFQERGATVAKVDGQSISQSDWDNQHRNRIDRLREQAPNIDAKLLDSPQARYATLQEMVRDRVLIAAAAKGRLTASDQRLARELESNEVIASLRGPDGRLNMDAYKQLLGRQGLTPQMFEEQVRSDIAQRQVLGGVAATGLATPAQASVSLGAFFERREVQVSRFDAAAYQSKVNPTPAEIEAFYKENPQLFQAPEQASIEYVVLDTATVQKGIVVNEQDLKTYYEQNLARLAGQEERRSSHILLEVPKNAPAAQREQAKAKAQELLDAARKAPQTFGELAKKNSADPVSAANGGDLDWSARGGYASKALEDVVFNLKKGEVGLAETEFGWHVVMVTDVRAPQQRSFEQVRPELEAQLRKEQAQRKFAESADAFSNAVYEASDGFKSVADRFKVEIRTANNVTRTPAPGSTGPVANPKFIAAIFSPESVEKKRNTEAVEIGPGQLASARIVQYSPARTRPLAEVQDDVRKRLVATRAAEMAKKEGMEKLQAWKANPASASLAETAVVSRSEPSKLPAEVVEAALRADPAALPQFAGVDLGPQGYAVVKVNKALPREAPPAPVAQQEVAQYTQLWTSAEALAYYEVLRGRFKAQILVPKPAPEAGATAQR
ncbi:peptidyl-prolyl cis-trans isomerase [Ramlibacter henchirensis]|uniref:Periplasmic chaperone PpiD n=1 Tax=Ramlibacter henchirensis TaxID=204072 RepID=A0A4Z0BR57_9BURK|nr:SurA N-terminal domain-containing protein [Ramlibacter henchirensis]TFZ00469.1 peptidyl-prolyl cis-trans isomerase [Ramlibacter henchirensis]